MTTLKIEETHMFSCFYQMRFRRIWSIRMPTFHIDDPVFLVSCNFVDVLVFRVVDFFDVELWLVRLGPQGAWFDNFDKVLTNVSYLFRQLFDNFLKKK
jgi:hypothetical protein